MVPVPASALRDGVASLPGFVGMPGGAELFVVFLLFFLVFLVVAVGAGYYVSRDARRHGMERPTLWGVVVGGLFLFGLVPGLLGVVIYLLVRE